MIELIEQMTIIKLYAFIVGCIVCIILMCVFGSKCFKQEIDISRMEKTIKEKDEEIARLDKEITKLVKENLFLRKENIELKEE